MQLTDEDRAGLSPEELKAIEGGDDDDTPQDDDDAGAAAASAGAAGAAAAAGAEDGQGQSPAAGTEGDGEARPAPAMAPAVEGYDAKVEALTAEKSGAFQKLMDGEITPEEYASIEARVSRDVNALQVDQALHKADIAKAQQTAEQEWKWECNRFFRDMKRTGVDYEGNITLGAALDANVKALASDPANAAKSGEWFLHQAHRAVQDAFGIKQAAQGQTKADAVRAQRQPDLTGIPQTLARAPVATEATIQGNEFAHIDGLTGMAYERALAALSPDQLDRYLGS